MGVQVHRGSIVVNIEDLLLDDASIKDANDARDDIAAVAEQAISNACDTYRHSLSLSHVDIESWDPTHRVAQVKLSLTTTALVSFDPSGTETPEEWADTYGWNYLVYGATDSEFDYELLDSDTGEDDDRADVRADDEVRDELQAANRRGDMARADLDYLQQLRTVLLRISAGGSNRMRRITEGLTYGLCTHSVHQSHLVGKRVASATDGRCDSCREGMRQQAMAKEAQRIRDEEGKDVVVIHGDLFKR